MIWSRSSSEISEKEMSIEFSFNFSCSVLRCIPSFLARRDWDICRVGFIASLSRSTFTTFLGQPRVFFFSTVIGCGINTLRLFVQITRIVKLYNGWKKYSYSSPPASASRLSMWVVKPMNFSATSWSHSIRDLSSLTSSSSNRSRGSIIEDHVGMVLETVSVVISRGENSSSCLIMRM